MLRAFLGTFVLLCLPAWAQTPAIQGTVEDQGNHLLASVWVRIEGDGPWSVRSTRTGPDGAFVFPTLPDGHFRVLCEADPPSAVEVQSGGVTVHLRCAALGIPPSDRAVLDQIQAGLQGDARQPVAEFEKEWEAGIFDWRLLSQMVSRSALLKDLMVRWNGTTNRTFSEGQAAETAKDYQTAIAQFHRVLAIVPDQPVVWEHLALCYSKLGWPSPALDAYGRAIEFHPNDANLRNNYGLALAQFGKLEDAKTQIEEAARLDPTGAGRYFYNFGAILVKSGRGLDAREAFRRAIEADPDYADAHFQYGLWLLQDGEKNRARDQFRTYLRLAPDGAHAQESRKLLEVLDPLKKIGPIRS